MQYTQELPLMFEKFCSVLDFTNENNNNSIENIFFDEWYQESTLMF